MALYERKLEPRCHVCQFIAMFPDFGDILEAKIADPDQDNGKIARYFNERFEGEKVGEWVYQEIDSKKIRTHRDKHMTGIQDIYVRAREQALLGNVSLEKSVGEHLSVMEVLKQGAISKVLNGEITIDSLSDYFALMDRENKLLGGSDLNINVKTGGIAMPPKLISMLIEVMVQFVPQDRRIEMRREMDEKVFPEFARYVEEYEVMEDHRILLNTGS